MSSHEPKKRLKAAESRRALLDAGLDLLTSRGVAPGLDRVTLKDAIEASGVPRSTAYRLYEGGRGQLEEYRADLLSDLDGNVDMELTIQAQQDVLAERAQDVESGDPVRLASVLRELIRMSGQVNVDSVSNNVQWRVYMSSLASAGSGEGLDPDITEMYKIAGADYGDRFVPSYQELCRVFGVRPRPPMTLNDFGSMASSMTEGVALRQILDPRLANIKRPTGPDGALQAWNAAAIAYESLVLATFEPDPEATVSADLSTWTAF